MMLSTLLAYVLHVTFCIAVVLQRPPSSRQPSDDLLLLLTTAPAPHDVTSSELPKQIPPPPGPPAQSSTPQYLVEEHLLPRAAVPTASINYPPGYHKRVVYRTDLMPNMV